MEKRHVNFELKQLEKVLKIYRGGRTKNEEIFHLFRLKSKSSEILENSFSFQHDQQQFTCESDTRSINLIDRILNWDST